MSWKTIAIVLLVFITVLAIIVGIALLIPTNMM